ncbi:caspase family protein [uncultured Methylobacterium sp.]|uniref:caspase family protein n=1 Tax=uncultured Methylobacterium sp. TaxID=157278 RepID=UPI0035CB0E0E
MHAVRTLALSLGLLLAALGCADTAAAAARSALIIANAAYPDSDAVLPGPVPDGRALADALKRSGFTVEFGENLARDAMQAAIDRFQRGVEPDGIALVFFGGYGIQVGKRNYLIPVDARVWSEADVARDGISVDDILDGLGKRGPSARVLVLDASRRNPFERRFRSFSTGLAPVSPAPGLLAISATAAGGVLNEAGITRSPFVAELVRQIGVADQDAEQAFTACRDAMGKRARGGPAPALVSQLDEPFSFDPDRPKAARRPEARPSEASVPDKAAKDTAAKDVALKDVAPKDTVAKEPADGEAAARQQAVREEADREKARQDRAGKDRIAADARAAEERAALDRSKTDQAAKDQAAKDQAAKDQMAKDQMAKDQMAKDQMAREQAASDRAARDRAAAEAESDDFASARAKGTRAAYEAFLTRHPEGALADRARTEIAALAPTERKDAGDRQRQADLDARIARDPRDEAAYYERGQYHAQRGDAAAAIADFDQAIRLNPLNPEAYNNRCWMRAMADALKPALADCNQALKLRPGFADALDSRGLVNLKAGAFRAAVSDYDAVLRLDPGRSSALYGRGVARTRLGEKALGSRDLASALQLNPALDREFTEYGLR